MKAQSAAVVFQVESVERAVGFYRDVLGFSEAFRFGDYAGVELGGVVIHLCGHGAHERPVGGGMVYVFCDSVDDYFAEVKGKGAAVKGEPRDYEYGLRDFTVMDLDGNLLTFGCEVNLEK